MIYDFKYFEAGIENGISGYQNYRWIPEISFPMAHNLALGNKLTKYSKILDFGCAKGFLLKAFHLLGYKNVYGVDISPYAIEFADPLIKSNIALIKPGTNISDVFNINFDLVIFKDVLEHIPANNIPSLMKSAAICSKELFIAVPLGVDNFSDQFVIPAMHNDITHITIKNKLYWESVIEDNGWSIEYSGNKYSGIKTNWCEKFPEGNLFVNARSKLNYL